MGQLIGKVVLTGGPCAGKTTALSRIEQELSEKGYRVFVIGESATELIKSGIRPFGPNAFDILDFQRLILKYQTEKEKIYEQAVKMLPETDKVIIIYDRGLIDNKAYVPKDFKYLIKEANLSELELLDNYDMVLHLVTAADGCPEHYTLENNEARSESIEDAIKLDQQTQNAWVGHNRMVIIDNSTTFNEKLDRVMENIYQLINEPYEIKFQKKYLVNLTSSNLDFLNNENINITKIIQTYLTSNDGYEKRLRKKVYVGGEGHYLTVQKKGTEGLNKVVTQKKLSQKDYEYLLNTSSIEGTLEKNRYSFIYKKQHLRLDIFDNGQGILEINPINNKFKIKVPKELEIEKEVTDDHDYDNLNYARRENKKKKLK